MVNSAINLGSSASVFNNLDLVTQWSGNWLIDTPGQWKGNKWNQSSYSTLHQYQKGELSMKEASVGSYKVDLSAFSGKTPPAKYRKLDLNY